ncbi:MAG: hypothetical protein KGQ38_06145 [Actinomycetales bacterium]|nr:hypothetical protein [Actinomycetales bacterium]
MTTFDLTKRFQRDLKKLKQGQREAFADAVKDFVQDLETGKFRPSLRVKRVQGTSDVFEMTWAPNGRATWQYGTPARKNEPHVIWRRVGTHDIFKTP